MSTSSPFSFPSPFQAGIKGLSEVADRLIDSAQAPVWSQHEVQHRLVLLINHVLMQEPIACTRLATQANKIVVLHWRHFDWRLQVTPAGLFNLADPSAASQLALTIQTTSVADMFQVLLKTEKPNLQIEGDVQLAAEMSWLADHVQWDVAHDVARIMGDAPAQFITSALQNLRGRFTR